MPRHQLVGAGRHIGDRETALLIRLGEVRIADGQAPALHVGVEAALHDEDSAVFAEHDQFFFRRSGLVFVIQRGVAAVSEASWMLWVHRKRDVEEDARTQM